MKRFLILASVMMLSAGAFAQQDAGTVTVQPKVGMNVANYASSEDSDPRVGLAVGAEFEYQISKMLGVSAGVMYSMQGAKSTQRTTIPYAPSVKATLTAKTDYINIPILANVYVFKGLALKVGVQPGFNVSSRYVISSQGVDLSGSLSDIDVDVKAFDFAIPVGISYEYKNIVLDARYNIGVTKIVENDDSKNRVFQLTLGYKFKL